MLKRRECRAPKTLLALLVGVLFTATAFGEALPLGLSQSETTWNYRSQRGVPISSIASTNTGSDGRLNSTNYSGSGLPATTNQFRGSIAFGASIGLSLTNWQTRSNSVLLKAGTTNFNDAVAIQMQLPMALTNGSGSAVVMVLRRAQVGAPYLIRQVSFPFGSEIPVPVVDENGVSLTNIVSTSYWLPQPYTTNGHTNSGYYWSPNAQKVYAIQPGPLTVKWVKASPSPTAPPDYATNASSYYTNGGYYFRIYTANYVIAGNSVKPPKKIYWTEKGFSQLGKPVRIPTARVSGVVFAYNNNFPRTVASQYSGPGDTSPTDGSTNQVLQELRTLWYDQQLGYLFAYNLEGRCFMELLGDLRPDGQTRQQLGIEIVDVTKQANALDVTTELGDQIVPPSPGTLADLSPEPVLPLGGNTFAYQQNISGSDAVELYAIRETANANDYMVHWMETGVAGLKWPSLFARYNMKWPSNPARYSHYVRPLVATETEAKLTAVSLPALNVPTIDYQDPLDQPRGKLDEQFRYYSFLTPAYPAHRALLHFQIGDRVVFERVFSWLDVNLKTTNFVGSVATNLVAWNPTNNSLTFSDPSAAPRVVNQTVNVGDRILAPANEFGSLPAQGYRAGYINKLMGISYDPNAYVDPLVNGFAAANLGAIIPVNAIPGTNLLEVWWFRTNILSGSQGSLTNSWPSVIGRYTIQWPTSPDEIVLASKLGSAGARALSSLEAVGTIYTQNDPTLPGYNPNEEHAIMSGGNAYATRDDLNITSGTGYSSAPFVLIEYTEADGRPAMSTFKVLREKPSAGWVFDYITEAGRLIQAPMPLPLLGQPVEGSGENAVNYNTEPTSEVGDLPGGWSTALTNNVVVNQIVGHYNRFTYRDRKNAYWVYRGPHSGLPALRAGTFDPASRTFINLSNATAVVGQFFDLSLHVSRQSEYLAVTTSNAPSWLQSTTRSNASLAFTGTPGTNDVGTNLVLFIVRDQYDQSLWTNELTLRVVATNGTVNAQTALVLLSTNSYTGAIMAYSNRAPFLAASPTASNSFTMRFYYKTEPSFAWPGVANPPAAGSIVPYLRAITNGSSYVGNGTAKTDPALDIVYRPVWPERDPSDSAKPLPSLPYGMTLTTPKNGLPGIRDWKTARIIYQQSVAANVAVRIPSALLIDPTREKTASITNFGLETLPASVVTELYQGKVYFPNLPPHLGKRLYFDPNRGAKGSLVLRGEFKDEVVGDDYLLLNKLRGSDLAAAQGLCPASDTANYPLWTNAIASLATRMETFQESTSVPGTFVVVSNALTSSVGVDSSCIIISDNTAVDSYALSSPGPGSGYVTLVQNGGNGKFTDPGDPVSLSVVRVGSTNLYAGQLKVLAAENPLSEQVTFQHTPDLGGKYDEYFYEWKIAAPEDGLAPAKDSTMSRYQSLVSGTDQPLYLLGGAGVQVLGDNYLTLRYKPINPAHPLYNVWSDWTEPQLAEGWIKRVLAGINPFNQRVNDLFNNAVNTDASILVAAGHRWEGDVALNLGTINNYGLIEIYETILRRGRLISIESGYNYGPANDALLLAAGYLSDLYMMEGGEAWADAANPTIGIGTANNTYGDITTALFAFKGQVPSLLEEELALLRGRDDFLLPGVQTAPVYNRLVWNYTRGIDAGEVIYALNYNIQENPNNTPDGIINAADAARMFPQGHGDAYGHYLTALTGYYSLLMNSYFDWVPRTESVLVLGQPVSVDYLDERKFAAAAAAVGRAGRQIFDLTWRKDFLPDHSTGWGHMNATRVNSQRSVASTRFWGADHWASRVGQGDYINWVVGNAILPAVDTNPTHEGIQKIDRTTVPELTELTTMQADLQAAMDSAEGGLTPMGLPANGVALDINPNGIVSGGDGATHFEQIYGRAKSALNNALTAFNDAKGVTSLMRSEQDSLAGVQAAAAQQELAYNNALIELYGTPYPDDVGPGKTYKQDYTGPDLIHFAYTETVQLNYPGLLTNTQPKTVKIDIQNFTTAYENSEKTRFDFIVRANDPDYMENTNYVNFTLDSSGSFEKPAGWTGQRLSPGKLQDAIARIQLARNAALGALSEHSGLKRKLDRSVEYFSSVVAADDASNISDRQDAETQNSLEALRFAGEIGQKAYEIAAERIADAADAGDTATPKSLLIGLATGGDLTSFVRGLIATAKISAKAVLASGSFYKEIALGAYQLKTGNDARLKNAEFVQPALREEQHKQPILELDETLVELQQTLYTINQRLQELDDAVRNYHALVAQGDRIQVERQNARQHISAVIQGYRTRDAAFRIFRNEKLERYKTLFDLAARYSFLAATAYDYETGLLSTDAGRGFINRVVSARSLGVMHDGEPQYAGSNTGDPGLSSALAEMKADWDVLKGRLGFNNPSANGTTASLRTENFRITPATNGDTDWKDLLSQHRVADVMQDEDVRRYCMQIGLSTGQAVPGIIIDFSTTIASGYNMFGQPLAAGDHAFSASSFATKIFGAGISLEGYRGMDAPAANSGAGGSSPPDPNLSYLDPLALAATPYVYLVPVGADSMRSPPLGDASQIRTWDVADVAIPLPFNIGASTMASGGAYLSADSLSEPLFTLRKHPAFRPVPSWTYFSTSLFGDSGSLLRTQYTSNRLIGRSVWNTKWKLVIPGYTLLNDPKEGLDRFIKTVNDIKLHFVTYSYSGN